MKKELTERQVERRNAIKETLKSMIAPVIFLAIIGAIIFAVVTYQNAEVPPEIIEPNAYNDEIEGPVVLENDSLKFTMDPETTQFELLVKSSGKTWKSCPEGSEDDPIALTEEKGKLQSTLVMSYNTEAGLETTYDSYNYSVKNKIYEVIPGEDQIEVKYSLGQVEKEYVIPPVCTAEDFEKWTGAMSKEGLNIVGEYYKKYDINNLGKKDNKDELLANYPIIESTVIYVLRPSTKENVKKAIQSYFEEAGYTYEQYLADKELDLSESVSDKPIFNVNVIYRLEGDELVVEVPLQELEYKSEYPIYTLTVLPFFGAGGKEDQGFMMVPEGGGAIINFNNGKTTQNSYYANVYGWDMCLSRKALVHNTRATFGVFGVSQGDDSFICVLEDGKSYASVQADISGKNNSYNYVNAVYSICQREQYEVADIANSEIYKYVQDLPDEVLTQRYKFVDSGSYVDMAKGYGSYLQNKYGDYMSLNSDTEAPVEVEILGAVDKVKQIVGVPVSRPLPLTTFEEAQGIIADLNGQGFNNMSVKMTGWCNGGVSQKILKDVDLVSGLGGKKGLTSLTDYAASQNVNIYFNGVTQYEYNSTIFDGFFSYTDAAKFITKERAELYQYSAVTYAQREGADTYYLLHTDLAGECADNLVNYASSFGAGVSFEDDGKDLSADYYVNKPYSREAVLNLQTERFKAINDAGQNLMVNMGNDYAVPYASMVTSMDLRGNDYTILDECIPFYQLAIHGYVNYTGYPLNICGDDVQQLLYSAEYGAGLSFTVMKESSFALQKTLYTEYYGSDYDAWRDRMVEYYTRYNTELGHVFNQEMVDHQNITGTLSVTTYADGTKVYVNYDFEDATADGQTIPARDYLVVRS